MAQHALLPAPLKASTLTLSLEYVKLVLTVIVWNAPPLTKTPVIDATSTLAIISLAPLVSIVLSRI